MNDKILSTSAERLGLRDSHTIKKAETFLRILNSKAAAKTVTDTSKIIICLDLAASNLGVNFDKTTALKLAGLKKTAYQNSLNTIEKILNLDKPITVSDLCVQLGCTEAKELAENILTKYQEHDKKIKDINHPQYVAAAVCTSCKINKIKVDKTRFKLVSRLKTAQWNELVEEIEKLASGLRLTNTRKKNKGEVDQASNFEQNENNELQNENKKGNEIEIEDYEVWKERILKEATIEILHNAIVDS